MTTVWAVSSKYFRHLYMFLLHSLSLLSLEEVQASKCSALIFCVCVKLCANSGRSSRPIEELALTRDWWTLMTLGSSPTKPRQGGERDIFSCHSPAPHQTRGHNPSYVREQSCEIRTPIDSDDYQTLPLSSTVKISYETQRLRWPWLFCLSRQWAAFVLPYIFRFLYSRSWLPDMLACS